MVSVVRRFSQDFIQTRSGRSFLYLLTTTHCLWHQYLFRPNPDNPHYLIKQLVKYEDKSEESIHRIPEAHRRLTELGERSQAVLIQHLNDERPSITYHCILPMTVGAVCFECLSEQVFNLPADYAAKREVFHRERSTEDYGQLPRAWDSRLTLFKKSMTTWLAERSHMPLRDIQIEALTWLVEREKEIGFKNEADKKLYLYPLQRQIQRLQSR